MKSLATFYAIDGRIAEAEALFTQILEPLKLTLGDEHPFTISSMEYLAAIHRGLGRYTKAETFILQTFDTLKRARGAEDESTLNTMVRLADLYRVQGRYAEAETLLLEAFDALIRTHVSDIAIFAACEGLAKLYIEQHRYAEAETLLLEAFDALIRTHVSDIAIFAACEGLAKLYIEQHRYAEAETFILQALNGWKAYVTDESPKILYLMDTLSQIYMNQRQYDEAESLHLRVLKDRDRLNNVNGLAVLYMFQGRYGEAEPLFLRVLEARERELGPEHPNTLTSLNNLAVLYKDQARLTEALPLARRLATGEEAHLQRNFTGSEQARQGFFDTFTGSTHFILSLHLDHAPDNTDALNLAFETWLRRKGRVLDAQADTLAALRRNLDADGQALLDKYKRLRRQEAQLRSANPADIKTQREDLAKAIQETEHGIATRSKAFAAQNQEVTIAGVQEALPEGAALLQYAIYTPQLAGESDTPPHLAAYLLHADGRLSGVNLGPFSKIQRSLDGYRTTQDPVFHPVFYTKLIAPVLSDPGALSHLFISPDGPLNLIPFEALQDDTGTPLLETVNISYLSTGRDLLRIGLHDDVETSAPVVFADPDFGPGKLKQLPATGTEADMLAKRFPKATVHRGAGVTVEALQAIDSPEILHIATHGFALKDDPHTLADNNPMTRSGLVLAGGNDPDRTDTRLRASEAVTLDLNGTRLVVLSACESGLGQAKNGEGVYGMRRALTLAGAASQVVSLWEVDDTATAVFMDGFYGRVQAGEPLGEALRTTKREMRASEKWGGTEFWAPFVLAGDWR